MTRAVTLDHTGSLSVATEPGLYYLRKILANETMDSPQLLLSRSAVGRNYDLLKQALPRADIHYAVKSNNHPAILHEINRLGGSFDVCSSLEIDDVCRAGARQQDLIHSHPIKSTRELDEAVAKGVRTFVVDNISEVEKLRRYHGAPLNILIRYRINTERRAVVNLQYKFGCAIDEVLPLAQKIGEVGQQYVGLCFHIGSQCIYAENYIQAIRAARELIEVLHQNGLTTRILDIGGGFPVEYTEPVPTLEELCQSIQKELDDSIDPGIRVVCEPGRAISASPVTLVCTIIGKSIRDGRVWYYLDDGLYSTFSGIVYDHCRYPVIGCHSGKEKVSVLAGPTCDSFDIMYDGLMMSEHDIGDRLAFPMTGAYCSVSGSTFNSLKRPRYMVID